MKVCALSLVTLWKKPVIISQPNIFQFGIDYCLNH